MRVVGRVTATMAAIVVSAVTPIAGRVQGEIGIRVFEDINYSGRATSFIRDVPDLGVAGLADRISSMRIASGESWEVCTGRDFTGRCQAFTGNVPDLRRGNWNDRIMSMRRVRSRGLELFAGREYSGQRVIVEGPVSNLERMNFNDRTMSIRVPPGTSWEVCVNADYDDCRVVDRDMADLGPIGVSRLISSVRPHYGGRSERGGRPRLVLFDHAGYSGHSLIVEGTTSTLSFFNDRAGSVQVIEGRWELCDRTGFGGRCITISGSVPDLRTLDLNDRISSVRPR
jgi:hypothetical protein